MTARDKAMNTWSKGKGFKDQVSDEEESGKDEETSMASKVRRKRTRTSEALQFLQVRSEKEAEARKEEISFKKEMAEKEAEARREDIAHKCAMASLEAKRQDLIQQQLQMQQQQMQQMQTLMFAFVSKLNQNDK